MQQTFVHWWNLKPLVKNGLSAPWSKMKNNRKNKSCCLYILWYIY